MSEPIFLTTQEVLEIHAFQVEEFGGDPAVLADGTLSKEDAALVRSLLAHDNS